jgi:hypothetical protein
MILLFECLYSIDEYELDTNPAGGERGRELPAHDIYSKVSNVRLCCIDSHESGAEAERNQNSPLPKSARFAQSIANRILVLKLTLCAKYTLLQA